MCRTDVASSERNFSAPKKSRQMLPATRKSPAMAGLPALRAGFLMNARASASAAVSAVVALPHGLFDSLVLQMPSGAGFTLASGGCMIPIQMAERLALRKRGK
jgi:hypothetical protein